MVAIQRIIVSDLNSNSTDVKGLEELKARREMLDIATQQTRFALLQVIVSHSKEAPSLRELELMNPSYSRSTIHEHLEKLIEVGVVKRVVNNATLDENELPSKFYTLTEEGHEVLKGTGLFDAADTLKYMYNSLKKTDEHKRYEATPRP